MRAMPPPNTPAALEVVSSSRSGAGLDVKNSLGASEHFSYGLDSAICVFHGFIFGLSSA
jgi:hypothetical protein